METLVRPFMGRRIGGVCLGLAKWLKQDVSFIRALFILFGIIGFGATFLLYIILWAIVPNE